MSRDTTVDAATQDGIKAAMAVARDLAEQRLNVADLDRVALDECRALFGTVVGPADALWPVQIEVARGVLALAGIPVDELVEWTAVARSRSGEAAIPSEAVSTPSEADSAQYEAVSESPPDDL